MNKSTKDLVIKILPLAIIYLLFMISFLNNSDYESLIVLILGIPLITYIFSDNANVKKYLKYFFYLVIIGIIIYWITSSSGVLNGVLYGYFSLGSPIYYFIGKHGVSGWELFTQGALFTVDLKILFYIGIIYLAIKNQKRIS